MRAYPEVIMPLGYQCKGRIKRSKLECGSLENK